MLVEFRYNSFEVSLINVLARKGRSIKKCFSYFGVEEIHMILAPFITFESHQSSGGKVPGSKIWSDAFLT